MLQQGMISSTQEQIKLLPGEVNAIVHILLVCL